MGANGATAADTGKPIQWVKHSAWYLADPLISHLIAVEGFEFYGRWWRLVELLMNDSAHAIPTTGERGYKRYLAGLGFRGDEELNGFIETLISYELLEDGGEGRYSAPLVNDAVRSVETLRASGRKGAEVRKEKRRAAEGQQYEEEVRF